MLTAIPPNIPPPQVETISPTLARDDLVEEVKLTIISHPYLDDTMNKIRQEPIPWEVKSTSHVESISAALTSVVISRNIQTWV